jgi:hypothetical protein
MFYFETERLVVKPHTMANLTAFNRWRTTRRLLYYNDEPTAHPSDAGERAATWTYL